MISRKLRVWTCRLHFLTGCLFCFISFTERGKLEKSRYHKIGGSVREKCLMMISDSGEIGSVAATLVVHISTVPARNHRTYTLMLQAKRVGSPEMASFLWSSRRVVPLDRTGSGHRREKSGGCR